NGIARLNPDGSLDASFDVGSGTNTDPAGQGPVGQVWAIAVQPDGKVLLGGAYALVNGQPAPGLARLNPNGSVDTSFNSGIGSCVNCAPPEVHGLGVLTNGQIMVSGVFNSVGAFFVNGLARLGPNGAGDITFLPQIGTMEQVSAMAV